jgi:RNA polymerase sigma-70 factor (ECF subfamily)
LSGEPKELKKDDGKPAGQKSFPMGIAAGFEAPGDACFLTSIRIHGGRYGYPQPPKEDFHVSLCDKKFKLIADFKFPYSKFKRADPEWVSLRLKPTKVPKEFVICLNFNAERTKGVYVSHDAEGVSLVGLPNKPAGQFKGGDWMIRPQLDTLKP